jgi:hypothetical protein
MVTLDDREQLARTVLQVADALEQEYSRPLSRNSSV